MITRFYVDNYKCLVNFEYKPKPMELIVGGNGSGKTTVFEALDKVRRFLNEGVDIKEIFPRQNRTKWIDKSTQIFEIDFQEEDKLFQYRLELDSAYGGFYVEKETLRWNGEIYIESVWKEIEGMKKNDSDGFSPVNVHGKESRVFTWNRSELEIPLSNPDKTIMSVIPWSYLKEVLVVKIVPPLIGQNFGKIEARLSLNGSNFASYYLYVLQQKQGLMFEVIGKLRDVLPGFDSFSVKEDFEEGRRTLNVNFQQVDDKRKKKNGALNFSFDEISDGQRALIVLYTLVFCSLDANTTLIIDEPENYIGLRELQPLILLMEEQVREKGGQILLISHNQEFINMLTDRGQCVRFYRENNGHTRIAEFNPDSELTAAEIVARGWEDDE